jgi:hypothetical protein
MISSEKWKTTITLCIIIVALLAGGTAAADDSADRITALEQEVQALRKELQAALETGAGTGMDPVRLAELERQIELLAGEIEKMRLGETAAEADESAHGFGPAASKVYRTKKGVSIGGYGEVLYQAYDSRRDDGEASSKTNNADFLRAILYVGYRFSDRWVLNTELEFEHGSTDEDGSVSVEFAYLDYLWRPEAGFRGGLVLLPMGFINELHEPTVYLGAQRPLVERYLIPSTWREIGVGLFGEKGPISYRTYIVTSMDAAGFDDGGLRGGRQKGSKAKAEDFSWVWRLDWTPVNGLMLGGSYYTGDSGQDLTLEDGSAVGAGTTIYEGHLEWRWQGLEFRALAARADVDDVTALNEALGFEGAASVGEKLAGQYLQLGYDLLNRRASRMSLTPYIRWEDLNTQDRIPAGFLADPANDQEIMTYGIQFQPLDQLVIKVDYQDMDNGAGTGIDQFNISAGYVF